MKRFSSTFSKEKARNSLTLFYLISGGTVDQWADITEWLVLRGAKKVVVSADYRTQSNCISRRLSLLQTYFNCDIIFAPNKAHTKEGAAELLSEVSFLGPVHAVFVLPQVKTSSVSKVSDIRTVQYIDNALRHAAPKALFVNFINTASGVCQLRSDAGYPTYNIQWLKELEFGDVLSGLDTILSLRVKNVLINNDKVSDSKQESTQALFKSKYRDICQASHHNYYLLIRSGKFSAFRRLAFPTLTAFG